MRNLHRKFPFRPPDNSPFRRHLTRRNLLYCLYHSTLALLCQLGGRICREKFSQAGRQNLSKCTAGAVRPSQTVFIGLSSPQACRTKSRKRRTAVGRRRSPSQIRRLFQADLFLQMQQPDILPQQSLPGDRGNKGDPHPHGQIAPQRIGVVTDNGAFGSESMVLAVAKGNTGQAGPGAAVK